MNNIRQTANTYNNINYSNIMISLSEEDYLNYMSNIIQLQYKKSRLFKNFEKENQNNYSILLSMNKYLNDKMQQSFIDIVDKINKVIELENNLITLCGNSIQSFNISDAEKLLGYITYVLKNNLIDIESNINNYREQTYSETKKYIANRDNAIDNINNELYELIGSDFCSVVVQLDEYLASIKQRKDKLQNEIDELHAEKSDIDLTKRNITSLTGIESIESIWIYKGKARIHGDRKYT